MQEEIIQIARRIKGLREIKGISRESLCSSLNISLDEYMSMENGKTDISVGQLIKISQLFQVELGAILTGEDPKLHQYCIVRSSHGIIVERKNQYRYENLAYNFINKLAEPFIVTAEPEEKEQDLQFNSHPGQEFNYVLEGSMKVFFENHEVQLHQGDSIYFDSSFRHAMKATDGKKVKFLALTM